MNHIFVTFQLRLLGPLVLSQTTVYCSPFMEISTFLQEKFLELKAKNPRASLRSLALKVGISAGNLSEIFNGRRACSVSNADKIARAMKLSTQDYESLLKLLQDTTEDFIPTSILSDDELKYFTDWEYYAILSLMRTDSFNADSTWIASRLGIRSEVVQTCINNLVKFGIVKWEDKQLVRIRSSLTTTSGIPSEALRKAHRNQIQKAVLSLDNTPVDLRDFSSLTIPMSTSRLPEVRKMITKFRRNLASVSENDIKDEVYTLSIQFFPLTVTPEKNP